MSFTQFAMVEELASLVKDNLPCKHLVLSMEQTLVDFLQGEASSNVVLELEPMNPYNRLLLHRLADIFGFSHQSVGEGDERHLILERCFETSIPSILVSDFLWQYDEHLSPSTSQIMSRSEASHGLKVERPNSHTSIEEREASYLAARQRIFMANEGRADEPSKQKPRGNPVVARRMIAHALGQRTKTSDEVIVNTEEYHKRIDEINIQEKKDGATDGGDLDTFKDGRTLSSKKHLRGKPEVVKNDCSVSSNTVTKATSKQAEGLTNNTDILEKSEAQKANLKKEQTGAAKRMFAHALGYNSTRGNSLLKCSEIEHNNRGKCD